MSVHLWLWLWLSVVAVVSSLVVVQPDGIVSIITELEPDKTPVAYLQAVDRTYGRGAPVVHETPAPPLAEGEYRVSSGKIRVVDPETGFKVVHPSAKQEVQQVEGDSVKADGNSERRSGIQAESAPHFRLVYPSIIPEGLSNYDDLRRINNENYIRNGVQRHKKPGNFGFQTPRRTNTVRTEKTTRIRNDNDPVRVYKQTIVRPVTQNDEIRTVTKHGKVGRYGKYIPHRHISSPTLAVGEVEDRPNFRSAIPPANDPGRRKTQKEYSSRTVARFPDGYAQGNERRVESSSKYKAGTQVKNSYKTPSSEPNLNRKFDGRGTLTNENVELDQPIEEASSVLGSGIIDGVDGSFVEESGGIYTGEGYGKGVGDYGGYGGYGGGLDKDKHFQKEKGKEYISAHGSSHGGKGQKGHNVEEAYSKGKSEQHGQDENKGYSVEKEGDKKSHLDKSSQFATGHQASEGAKGTDFQKEKGHRKGHKKSGFRTVHHKDEYKKNEEFYDEEHNSGEEKHQGHKSTEHVDKSGGEDQKSYLDSGHHQASRGHEGGHEKGHGYEKQKGFNKDKGHSGHYDHEEEHGKKSGHSEGEVHGHSGYGGQGHGYH